jgi:hypothetical protein
MIFPPVTPDLSGFHFTCLLQSAFWQLPDFLIASQMAGLAGAVAFGAGKEAAAQAIDRGTIARAKEQLNQFQTILRDFAKHHRDKINSDPEFREAFLAMCERLNVDPLQSRGGFWAKFNFGQFLNELAVKIVDVCDPLKRKYGTLIPLNEVIAAVSRTYGPKPPKISEADIVRAFKSLREVGQGYSVVRHGPYAFLKAAIFEFKGHEVALLEKARDSGFFQYAPGQGMSQTDFEAAATALMSEGVVWIDRGDPGEPPKYWVTAFFRDLR